MDISVAVITLRAKLNDLDKVKFPEDSTLETEIKEVVKELDSEYTVETVPEEKEYLVIKKALINSLRLLAIKYSEGLDISSSEIDVDRTTRVKRVLDLASNIEEDYNKIVNDPSFREIKVNDLDRYVARYDEELKTVLGDG
jgi:hypothetical protein